MKNFPHQYNDLRKLRATLETVRDLNEAGQDADDDGVLGYALARRRIYGFRGLDYTGDAAAVEVRVEGRIVEDEQKPSGKQGARTAAREMRRTLRYLRWLDADGTELTPAGEALLETAEGSDEEQILMQQAIASIAVADRDGRISHPVQVLLKLVDEVDLDSRSGMELALEAVDDSVGEFRRVAALAELDEDARVAALEALDWTTSQLANAVKILPAFAEQSGLMTTDGTGRYILTDAGRRALGRAVIRTPPEPPAAGRRRRRPRRRATTVRTRNAAQVGRSRRLGAAERRALTPEEQAAAAELLYERTERHQELVRTAAAACREADFYEDAAAYDLLIDLDRAEPLVLSEVKTISGDAAVQIRAAVGQILFYEHFAVAEQFPDRAVRRLVVVDERVDEELAAFLEAHEIGLIAIVDDEIVALNDLGEDLRRDLFG
ncbi:MAG TPA: hypothetical protein VNA57_03980 [Acidimicrobiales bacterium]|nr:hypothetical protein [Acidimicrobiales bacterium]